LFSHIAMNWRGTPLVDLATIVSLIGSTHSRAGLRVRSELDRGPYPGGVTVTDTQMATVHLERHRFHGDWNYTIQPAAPRPRRSLIVWLALTVRAKTPTSESSGSGFIVDASGTIVTNLHVIRGAVSVAVKTTSNDIYDDVMVRAFDERKDLAVIQVAGFGFPRLGFGDSESVQPGQRVVVIGNALGMLEGSVSTGVVSGIRNMDGYKVFQTDATANHGNSGGPLLNENGEVVGVVTFKLGLGSADNLNFAVPINYVRGMMASTDLITLAELETRLGKGDLFSNQPTFPRRWRSLATGTTKIVRVDGDRIYVETVVPQAQAQAGSFNLADLNKADDKYVGIGRTLSTCSYQVFGGERLNQCREEFPIEITLLTPSRIEGRAPGPGPSGVKFDCRKCTRNPPFTMQPFTWIPE
jgi:hypothetical protein